VLDAMPVSLLRAVYPNDQVVGVDICKKLASAAPKLKWWSLLRFPE
jgi:hypothetical protein